MTRLINAAPIFAAAGAFVLVYLFCMGWLE